MKNRFLHNAYQLYKPVRRFLDQIPMIGSLLVNLTRVIRNIVLHLYVFLSRFTWFTKKDQPPAMQLPSLIVNPSDIKYRSNDPFQPGLALNEVKSGNWDRLTNELEFGELLSLVRQVIEFGEPYQQTDFYQTALQKIEIGEGVWGCHDEQQLSSLCSKLVNFSVQYQAQQSIPTILFSDLDCGLMIDIGRFGNLLFVKGILSLVLAHALKLDSIPATVRTRHSKWLKLSNRYRFLVTGTAARAYQPSLHPDLTWIPAQQSCVERFEMIQKNLSQKNGNILELGANIGYFSINLENMGFVCTAVENSPIFLFCLKTQKRALQKNLKIISKSFLVSEEIQNHHYDVILALNIFHHFQRRKADFEKLSEFLENLKCKELYFEPHVFTDPQLKNAYINMQEKEFVNFILSKTKLTTAELIGRASDKRPIYKLS